MSTRSVTVPDSAPSERNAVDLTVTEPYQVNWLGTVYGPGESVPNVAVDTADKWIRWGFATCL